MEKKYLKSCQGKAIIYYLSTKRKWLNKLFILVLFISYLNPMEIFAQGVPDYFPMDVGNKWVFRGTSTESVFFFYGTGFEVVGKEIINDTLYYKIKSGFF